MTALLPLTSSGVPIIRTSPSFITMMRSTPCLRMKSMLCSMIRTEIPVSSTILLRLLNVFIASGPATPATGSSRSSSRGSPIIERPMSTSLLWPPDSSLARLKAM